jgi:putative methyltransferase (TIGR04325 family)
MTIKQKIIQRLPDGLFVKLKQWGWYGNFKNWQEADAVSTGYNAENIIGKVASSLRKVKNGEAVYERDSVIFDKIEYSWELLSLIMWVAAQNGGMLNLIDFGGSLGSTYYQNKKFLDKLNHVSWRVVEQKNYVKVGIEEFQNDVLRFYYSIGDCCAVSNEKPDVILFSSVLQYLENPFEILKESFGFGIRYIIVDRTGFTLNNKQRITVQKVPSRIYDATYPCRFFSEKEFLSFFEENNYELMVDFEALDSVNIPSKYKGFLFRLKDDA